VEQGIESISLNHDSGVKTLLDVAASEQRLKPVLRRAESIEVAVNRYDRQL